MILVSMLFVITWTPSFTLSFLMNIHARVAVGETGFYATVLVCYLYIVTNPFIYAANFDPIYHVLLGLAPCRQTTTPPVSFQMT